MKRAHGAGGTAATALVALIALACAGSTPADGSKLVPKDYKGCVQGGGRLDPATRTCHLQISERRDPTAFAYCMSSGGIDQARGSVAGLRTAAGGTRGRVCTLTYDKGPSRERLDAYAE